MAIKYLKGDAVRPVGEGTKLLIHICNDIGAWGSGFVLAVNRLSMIPKRSYLRWKRDHPGEFLPLGDIQLVRVSEELYVGNLIGQHLVRGHRDLPEDEIPLRYGAVRKGLETVAGDARHLGASVHMPRIGCGLAGGSWDEMGPLIEEELEGLDVTVYDHRPWPPA